MVRITRGACVLPFLPDAVDAMPTPLAESVPEPGILAERGDNTRRNAPLQAQDLAVRIERSVLTRERLHKLRTRLASMHPKPRNRHQARETLLLALSLESLDGWTVPGFDSDDCEYLPGGSVRLRLIAHEIIVNPWGAYRILDRLSPDVPYFESAGHGDRPFTAP